MLEDRDYLYVLLIVVGVASLPLLAFLAVDHFRTPLERQQLLDQHYQSWSIDLNSDGCYWRTYVRKNGAPKTAIEINPNGSENCPYRKIG